MSTAVTALGEIHEVSIREFRGFTLVTSLQEPKTIANVPGKYIVSNTYQGAIETINILLPCILTLIPASTAQFTAQKNDQIMSKVNTPPLMSRSFSESV